MFDRGKSDATAQGAIPVEITLADGTIARGKLLLPTGKSAGDALNGSGAFIEFAAYGDSPSFLAKAQLTSVRLTAVPAAPSLGARPGAVENFDPHAVLGVSPAASREEVRQAYFALAKTYHPDRYAATELPCEVRDYLAAMARRINAAHAALEVPEKRRVQRQEPVFTTAGR
jgi:hypothetical protein